MKLIFVLFLLFALLIIYLIIEHMMIAVRRQDVYLSQLPEEFEGLRILQISDLHHRKFGENQRRIVDKAAALSPDMIVITGDLISRDERNFIDAGSFCSQLTRIAPVYFSAGNHELDLPSDIREEYFTVLRDAGVRVLLNETEVVMRGDASIAVTGAMLRTSVYRDENFSYKMLDPYSADTLTAAIGVRQRCTVLLMHNPLIFDSVAAWGADLILSGHVHGGVVRLPFIGGTLSPERRFFPRYTRGLYKIGNSQLYVSSGLGKLRFLNPPEINIITLRQK